MFNFKEAQFNVDLTQNEIGKALGSERMNQHCIMRTHNVLCKGLAELLLSKVLVYHVLDEEPLESLTEPTTSAKTCCGAKKSEKPFFAFIDIKRLLYSS